MTFTRRALITILTPLFLVMLSDRLVLPGLGGLAEQAHVSAARLGVFSLGIVPLVSAYQLVEVIAFLVPSWSRRRHGDPRFRAKLELAVHVVALALAAIQAFNVARYLRSLGVDSPVDVGHISVPIVVLTLVGGVCLQIVLAKTITRMGLANGVAVLLGAGVLSSVYSLVMSRVHPTQQSPEGGLLGLFTSHRGATPVEIAVTVGAIALVFAATIVTLARANGIRLGFDEGSGGPYRGARALALHPNFPVPSSSYGAFTIARSLILLVALLGTMTGTSGLGSALDRAPGAFMGVVLVVMVLLSFWMHRPKELADLSERLGIKTDPSQARRALVSTLLPSFLFFVVLMLSAQAASVDLAEVPLGVAVIIDLVVSARLMRGSTTWTPVWEERRATAVPVLRAVLAARGIATEVTGMSLLWLMQLFAPFAPAVILVKEEDRERAQAILSSLAFAPGEDATAAEPVTLDAPELPPRRRAAYLAALVVVSALAAFVAMRLRDGGFESAMPVASGPPAQLELLRIDDIADPLASVRDDDLPKDSGISIYSESAPAGGYETKQVHFARIVARDGEPRSGTRARLLAFLGTVKLPADDEPKRFALEEMEDVDGDTRTVTFIGYRSFLLTGSPELTNADVDDAMVVLDRETQEPRVNVALTQKGAARFEDVTGRWVQRRLAIVLDGVIQSAPVIKSKIGGGHLTITMGRAEPEKALFDARHLEQTLRGHQ